MNPYQFPRTRFTRNTLWRQWWHLLSEVLEVGRALLSGHIHHAGAEVWDVKHSAETLHRILEGYGVDIAAGRDKVISNNKRRDYYVPLP